MAIFCIGVVKGDKCGKMCENIKQNVCIFKGTEYTEAITLFD